MWWNVYCIPVNNTIVRNLTTKYNFKYYFTYFMPFWSSLITTVPLFLSNKFTASVTAFGKHRPATRNKKNKKRTRCWIYRIVIDKIHASCILLFRVIERCTKNAISAIEQSQNHKFKCNLKFFLCRRITDFIVDWMTCSLTWCFFDIVRSTVFMSY